MTQVDNMLTWALGPNFGLQLEAPQVDNISTWALGASPGRPGTECPGALNRKCFDSDSNASNMFVTEKKINWSCMIVQEPDVIDVEELMKDLEDDEDMDFNEGIDNEENIGLNMATKNSFYQKPNPEFR
uniref:Uncharacterized protein n=1 Tax=Cannabis sativa TaxID=3483 RepID=A0A803NN25_CANSA